MPYKGNTMPNVKVMKLDETGLSNELKGTWYPVNDYFESEDSIYSAPFFITGARTINGQFGQQVVFTIEDAPNEHNRYLTSLNANDERLAYVDFYRQNRNAIIGAVAFKRLPTNSGNYIKIVDADEIESEED